MLLDLACDVGLHPTRTSSTKGGEYHSACPACGGKDRFMIWSGQGRYWCRQCRCNGDAIQFCRDFLQMSFSEAKDKIGEPIREWVPRFEFTCANRVEPKGEWIDRARKFCHSCCERLLVDGKAMEIIKKRGINQDTVCLYKIGWNPVSYWVNRSLWGFPEKIVDGKKRRLYLPKGIVIPVCGDVEIVKIKIRKELCGESDPYGKYYEMPGSTNQVPVFGDKSKDVVVILESEFDAMLLIQEAGDLCCCLALGGAQKKLDSATYGWLQGKKHILYALDFDDAGKKEYGRWKQRFHNLHAWPVPAEKSPGDAYLAGISLKDWILAFDGGKR